MVVGAGEGTGSRAWRAVRRVAVVVGIVLMVGGGAGLALFAIGGDDMAAGPLRVAADGAHVGSFEIARASAGSLVVVDLAVRGGGPRLDVDVTIAPSGEQPLRSTYPTTTNGSGEVLFRVARWRPSRDGAARVDVRVASSERRLQRVGVTVTEGPFDHMEIAFVTLFAGMALLFAGGAGKR